MVSFPYFVASFVFPILSLSFLNWDRINIAFFLWDLDCRVTEQVIHKTLNPALVLNEMLYNPKLLFRKLTSLPK